jgi:hypothetical protein
MRKIKFLYFPFLLLLFFIWGFFTLKNQIFPFKFLVLLKTITYDQIFIKENKNPFEYYYKKYPNFEYKKPIIIKYTKKGDIWVNRIYSNHENDDKLLNFHLIKIERHSVENIVIEVEEEITIYRATCELNNNSIYNDWEKVDFKIAIIGKSCVHARIVKKKFKERLITLSSGGPISSDPIFIKGLSSLEFIRLK